MLGEQHRSEVTSARAADGRNVWTEPSSLVAQASASEVETRL